MGSWCSTVLALSLLVLTGCSSESGLPDLGAVPPFQLTDQNGHAFDSASELQNHIWVADFIYTNCPGPCPRMSSQFKQVQTFLSGTQVKLVSFTIDPEHDTPKALFDYSRHFDARAGTWYFLTGPKDMMHSLSRDGFKLHVSDDLEHDTHFVLVDRNGHIRGFYQSLEAHAVDQLVADAKSLLKERRS
jgi:protein SCO1/2